MKVTEFITKKECKRCGHEWYPKAPGEPIICPKCKSPYWNRDKQVNAAAD